MGSDISSGSRIARTAGQAGGSLVLIDLWHSFGWFGAGHWSTEQAATRWPAITATAVFVIAVLHNVGEVLAARRKNPTADTSAATTGSTGGAATASYVMPAAMTAVGDAAP